MEKEIIIGLTTILVLGILARWLSWRLHVPAILILLLTGLVAGPFTGLLQPDKIFGPLLFPIISFSVAIILFEGALDLSLEEMRRIGTIVRNLLSIGLVVTWILASLACYYILGLPADLSALVGAILTVTGPTVVTPLIRFVRPRGESGSILKWEGIVVDPIGAVLAVLVFEIIRPGQAGQSDLLNTLLAVVSTIVVGGGLGFIAARLLVFIITRNLLPRNLHNPFAFMSLITVFAVSNMVQHEAGLLSVTVMGFILANSRGLDVTHIVEFKENLRVLLIASLFIILAARIELEQIQSLDPLLTLAFIGSLIFLVRPLSVFASTVGSKLNWREKIFLSAMAPRGIVAAAVSAILGLDLVNSGRPEGALIAPVIFAVIVGTVLFYSIIAGPTVRLLGLRQNEPRGVLLLGGHNWVQDLAATLLQLGVPVVLVDTNRENIRRAKQRGLFAVAGNFLEEGFLNRLDLNEIGSFLALTPNDEVNSLAAVQLRDFLEKERIFQLSPASRSSAAAGAGLETITRTLGGRRLFDRDLNFARMVELLRQGWVMHTAKIESNHDYQKIVRYYQGYLTPLIVLRQKGTIEVLAAEDDKNARRFLPGDRLVCVAKPPTEA